MPKPISSLAIALLGCLALAACSSGPRPHGSLPRDRNAVDRMSDAYVRAVELQNAGKCDEAVKLLRRAAEQGPGYEDAQRRLGECLIQLSNGDKEKYAEGLLWLKRAAEAGWPEAEGALAYEYVTGPEPNLIAAAKWLTLYDTNPRKKRVAFTPMLPSRVDRIRAALTPETLAEGRAAAAGFVPTVWEPPPEESRKARSDRDDDEDDGERPRFHHRPPNDDDDDGDRPVGGKFPQPSE
ncbi:MAG: tetratricopeptide repeat protein [Alphaproteobacteria bacterium]|nr:tetratricopeptide repeat protein [Alphaproteobacteria bacterium]